MLSVWRCRSTLSTRWQVFSNSAFYYIQRRTMAQHLVGAIDQGTTSTRFMVFDEKGNVVGKHQIAYELDKPHPGWTEVSAWTLLHSVQQCISNVSQKLSQHDAAWKSRLRTVGMTNQRESLVAWHKKTGEPYHPAIIWSDTRTAAIVDRYKPQAAFIKQLTGLPISTYFTAVKMRWLMENVHGVKADLEQGDCLFGTVDSWLLWHLTGGAEGGCFKTDVTNASRTLLMNLKTLQWDTSLLELFGIPRHALATIQPSTSLFGRFSEGPLHDTPITGVLGDQHASLFGHRGHSAGDIKNTYGTGCFLLYNTGDKLVESKHGLLTTMAYQMEDQPPSYALEGSVAVAGTAIEWLRSLGLVDSGAELSKYAAEANENNHLYFVPAFSGLFAPYWRTDARGLIIGLTAQTSRNDLCRAVLESIALSCHDVLEAIEEDTGRPVQTLRVDGGVSGSALLMHMQSGLGVKVIRPSMTEVTSLGAAFAAGLQKSVKVWSSLETLPADSKADTVDQRWSDAYKGNRLAGWHKAVHRTFDWESPAAASAEVVNTKASFANASILDDVPHANTAEPRTSKRD